MATAENNYAKISKVNALKSRHQAENNFGMENSISFGFLFTNFEINFIK